MGKNLIKLIKGLEKNRPITRKRLYNLQRKYTKENGDLYSKVDIITAYKQLAGNSGIGQFDPSLVAEIRKKPSRTTSGVTPVTVLTKAYPCPGQCIFCPEPDQMPKSYLPSEPGSQRAERNQFDPYLQTYNRVQTLANMGHPIDKIELIILGGTWSAYPEDYQIWFIRQCFRALNDIQTQETELKPVDYPRDEKESAGWNSLIEAQKENETALARNVGLVVETRPDSINSEEVIRLRKLGATKIQLGIQFLDDDILTMNKRGHGIKEISKAFSLLRSSGFKIQAHWMVNLYGSNPEKDKKNYLKIFENNRFKPDELKIYPCSLLADTELLDLYQQGKWQPYNHQQLVDILKFCLINTPRYCRLNRVIRDIPSPEIIAGNKLTNLRQVVEETIAKSKKNLVEIRSREIRAEEFDLTNIKLKTTEYQTIKSKEIFLEYVTPNDDLLGFLRLSLPEKKSKIEKLNNCSIIREVHVYGQSTPLDTKEAESAQHTGLGTKLISAAKKISQQHNYKKMAVISAVGTREYYRKLNFLDGDLYQTMKLS